MPWARLLLHIMEMVIANTITGILNRYMKIISWRESIDRYIHVVIRVITGKEIELHTRYYMVMSYWGVSSFRSRNICMRRKSFHCSLVVAYHGVDDCEYEFGISYWKIESIYGNNIFLRKSIELVYSCINWSYHKRGLELHYKMFYGSALLCC